MNALPKTKDAAAACPAQLDHPGKERAGALHSAMTTANITCDRCEGILLNNKAYRVRTEDHGLVLLDMIVCYACNLEVKNLGLKTDEVEDLNAEAVLALRNTRRTKLARSRFARSRPRFSAGVFKVSTSAAAYLRIKL